MKNLQLILLGLFLLSLQTIYPQDKKPNILLITLDDMNWDSPACYGGPIPDLTPKIDRLAQDGIRFEKAYVQASNCSPSRVVIQTGLYPHQSGTRGFFYVKDNIQTLPEILKANGYFTGAINKLADSSLSPDFENYWDETSNLDGGEKYNSKKYSELTTKFFSKAKQKQQPFYCVVNIADPHKPFFNDAISKEKGFDKYKPSKIFTLDDITVPEFLPETPEIKQQVLNYYNSVKRADDGVGTILASLNASGLAQNTIIIFLSDHGMPFPYAKSSVYQNGVKTPLIVSWPGKIAQSSINKSDLVSAVDIAPTILNIATIPAHKNFEGKSFYKSLFNENTNPNTHVYAQFDENAGGVPRPSRTVISERFGYIFNPWATSKYEFTSDATYHPTFKQMQNLSTSDGSIKKRFDFWIYRAVEELYDYVNDPNALNNLIDNPDYKDVVFQLRNKLQEQMQSTNDYVLDAFQHKEDRAYLNAWMEKQIEDANLRNKTIKWKRYQNTSGPTKNNKQLYIVNSD